MTICIVCGSPNPDETDIKYFDLPTSSSNPEWHTRFMSELGIILESEQQLKDMKICENHFNAEDIITENETYRLKENALPVNNLIDNFDYYYIKPELVYMNTDEDTEEKNCGTKNFTNLSPLVVYAYENEDSDHEKEAEDNPEYVAVAEKHKVIKQEEETQQTDDQNQNVQNVIDHVAGGGNTPLVEPMMPFFLSDPSVFTILNENDEVGETIIVQIENDSQREAMLDDEQDDEYDEEEDVKFPKNRYVEFENDLPKLERTLCSSKNRDYSSTYVCDICDSSYGCIKCLKSHYETLHVSQLQIVQYKCQNSPNLASGLYCPVCDLVFTNRTDTLDHYVTHYVACDICCSAFDRPMYLTKHMKAEHQKVDQNLDYECELCQNSYQYPSYLSKHYQIYHKMNLCITCKVRFKTVQELHEHESVHLQKSDILPYACSRCDMAFPKISDITVHIRAVHKQTASEKFVHSLGNKQFWGKPKPNVDNETKHSENLKENPTKKVKVKK